MKKFRVFTFQKNTNKFVEHDFAGIIEFGDDIKKLDRDKSFYMQKSKNGNYYFEIFIDGKLYERIEDGQSFVEGIKKNMPDEFYKQKLQL
ncbi:hypothetical protein QWY31_02090 [Cytophagales bacterium LB-30]|uniref:Uncharacterized protein n=1 Tax=Shiella aurantiaca TaxID=3058365 RepID=A0ABT8F1I8_9BACT|nr:hypothetical protein [Shiella aurantiaca]MDN4164270.1 hypothetical protein [Shiella aurantiaca]